MGRRGLFAVSTSAIKRLSKYVITDEGFHRFAKAGTTAAAWEEQSWLPLSQLAESMPESGVHFQSITTSSYFLQEPDKRGREPGIQPQQRCRNAHWSDICSL